MARLRRNPILGPMVTAREEMQERMVNATDAELDQAEAATVGLTTTNCSWAEYDMADLLRLAVKSERGRRAYQLTRKATA